ncbi:MAG: dnaK suppressor [Dehalococcoidia bacterium]|jgi:DnaK suppressor protein|nr:dnaK suppressor [Dehalococcoidia bacterium]
MSSVSLTPEIISNLRMELERDRRRILVILAGDSEEIQEMVQGDVQWADAAAASEQKAQVAAEARDLREELTAVESALARLQGGNYGVCIDCGRLINPERLLTIPSTLRDAACQAKFEEFARARH